MSNYHPLYQSSQNDWRNNILKDTKQLLDEVEHDIMNYQNWGLCYLPKPKAEADNTDIWYLFDISILFQTYLIISYLVQAESKLVLKLEIQKDIRQQELI